MSTLTEIEAAVEALPRPQQEELLAFLVEQMGLPKSQKASEDPFAAVIGAFAGPQESTGRNAEKILYGKGA